MSAQDSADSRDDATSDRQYYLGLAFILIGAVGFSAKAVLIKLAYAVAPQLDAITLMALRMGMSLPVFLLVLLWQQSKASPLMSTGDWFGLLVFGALGYYLAALFDFMGLQYISAGLERLVLFLYPTMVVLISALMERRAVSRLELQALVVSYLGVALVIWNDFSLMGDAVVLGVSLVFLSALSFAVYLVGSARLTKRMGSARFTAYSMSAAAFCIGGHFGVSHDWAVITQQPEDVYVYAAIMAVFSTILPAFMINAGMKRLGAAKAALLSTIGPVSPLFLAQWFLLEPITTTQLMGTALVIFGVWLVGSHKRAKSG